MSDPLFPGALGLLEANGMDPLAFLIRRVLRIGGWCQDQERTPRRPSQRSGRKATSLKRSNPKLAMQKETIVCSADYPDCECGELRLSTRAWRQCV